MFLQNPASRAPIDINLARRLREVEKRNAAQTRKIEELTSA